VAEKLWCLEEAGLDVTINLGSGTVYFVGFIAAGTADFGPGDAATAFIVIANQGLELKAVAAVQQNNFAVVIALEPFGIRTPQDLAGKTFADAAGSTCRILLPAYTAATGFDGSTVEFVAAAPPDLPACSPPALSTSSASSSGVGHSSRLPPVSLPLSCLTAITCQTSTAV